MESYAYDFFIAHPPTDVEAACELHERLSSRFKVFTPTQNLGGMDDWDLEIPRAQATSFITVVLVSGPCEDLSYRTAIATGLNRAQRDGKHKIVPVYLGGKAPADPLSVPYGLFLKQGLPAAPGLESVAVALSELARTAERPTLSPEIIEQPYRCLAAFTRDDAELFFGRELAKRDLVNLIKEGALTVLHGASGCGKTSLIAAGAVPLLEHEFDCRFVTTPAELASCAASSAHVGRPLFVILDQAESFFQNRSPSAIRETARALVEEIHRLLADSRSRLLISIRDDYFGHLAYLQQAGLPEPFSRQMLLPALDSTSTRLAIREPLRRAGLSISTEVVQCIIRDLEEDNQVRPVELEIICSRLFEEARRTGTAKVELKHYLDLGDVRTVLSAYVGSALEDPSVMGSGQEGLLVLEHLLGPSGNRQRPVPIDVLARSAAIGEQRLRGILDRLISRRLVQATQGDAPGEGRYQISHDLVAQEIFRRLSAEQRRDIEMIERLRAYAGDWERTGRPWMAYLARGVRRDLRTWRARTRRNLDELLHAYLRSVERWHRFASVFRWALPVAVVFGIAAGAYGLHLREAARLTEHAAQLEAAAGRAEALAISALERDPGKTLAWLAEAGRIRGTMSPAQWDSQWFTAMSAWQSGLGWAVARHPVQVINVQLSPRPTLDQPCAGCWPQRKLLLSSDSNGALRVTDLEHPERSRWLSPDGNGKAVFSPDGDRIYAGRGATLRIWDANSGALLKEIAPPEGLSSTDEPLWSMAVSADGSHVAAGGKAGFMVWDVRSLTPIGLGEHATVDLAFSPRDSRVLVILRDDGHVLFSDLEARRGLDLVCPGGSGNSLDFTNSGRELAVASGDVACVFEVPPLPWKEGRRKPLVKGMHTTNEIQSPELTSTVRTGGLAVTAVRSGTKNSLLFTGDQQGQVIAFSGVGTTVEQEQNRRIAQHRALIRDIKVFALSDWILSADDKGELRLTHESGVGDSRLLRGHEGRVRTIDVSADERLAVSGGADGVVRLWPLQQGRTAVLSSAGNVFTVASARPDELVLAGLRDGGVQVWRNGFFKPETFNVHQGRVEGACVFGPHLVVTVGRRDKTIRAWDPEDGRALDEASLPATPSSAACTSRGLFVAAGSRIFRWSPSMKLETIWELTGNSIRALAANEEHIAVATEAGSLWVRSSAGSHFEHHKELTGTVEALTVSGQWILYTDGQQIRRWAPGTAVDEEVLPRAKAQVTTLAADGTGAWVTAASADSMIRMWRTASWNSIVWQAHAAPIAQLAAATDVPALLSAGVDGSTQVWFLPPAGEQEFRGWLGEWSPWSLKDGTEQEQPLPRLDDRFLGRGNPPPSAKCIELCREVLKATRADKFMSVDQCVAQSCRNR
jgi:WD40 repeat protein/energy-coupling factor transporter ATP-binding protein EcfA2